METLKERNSFSIKDLTKRIGVATIIIAAFWVLTLIVGGMYGMSIKTLLTDTIKRAGMNGVLVLAMVPSIQSGTGPNFALPIGVVCGLLAMVCAIEFGFVGWGWFWVSIIIATPIAIVVGYFYGKLLNAVKGSEMTIATYTGFSVVSLMCLAWLMIPFKSTKMGWMMGKGLRETIQLEGVGAEMILNKLWAFEIFGISIPTGLLLFLGACCIIIWLFFRSKVGIAISAGGINPGFAHSAGLNINRGRAVANIISTILAAVGIIVYSQSYGYAQLYTAPLMMAFAAIAAILIGGATAQRAKVSHVLIGVFLYQGLMTAALPVANEVFAGTDLSEILRMIIQNGIILYALTQVKGGGK